MMTQRPKNTQARRMHPTGCQAIPAGSTVAALPARKNNRCPLFPPA